MSSTRVLWHVARSDLRQRLRSPKYLIVPLLVAVLAQTMTSGHLQLVVGGGYTGVPNAAWFGGAVASFGTFLLVLVGHSLVSGAINRERTSGVGEFVGTAPVSGTEYLLGRWLGYVALLTLVTAFLALATVAGFLSHGTGPLDLWALLSPFLFLTVPAMALVAAVSICFECIPLLRGTFGTVVYFFGAIGLLMAAMAPDFALDPTGISVLRANMLDAIPDPTTGLDRLSFSFTNDPESVEQFTWHGVEWGLREVAGRLGLVLAATPFLGVAVLSFDRFRPSESLWDQLVGRAASTPGESGQTQSTSRSVAETEPDPEFDPGELSPVSHASGGMFDRRLLGAELRMALRGQRVWWYLALCGAVLAGVLAPLPSAHALILPLAFLLPLSVWSEMGVRERRYRTTELVVTSGKPVRQALAVWVAGVVVAALLVAPVGVRLLLAGEFVPLASVLVATVFVPSLSLAAGSWLGSARAFEILFLLLWYVGPMNDAHSLDFIGGTLDSGMVTTPVTFGVAAVALLGAAVGNRLYKGRQ